MADYGKLKKAELKELLRDRRLRIGGHKSVLIQRLSAFDESAREHERRQKIFRFLDLPSEIRLIIYKMISAHPDNWCEFRNLIPFGSRSSVSTRYANHRRIAQPTIFHTCRHVRLEGLGLFYKGRNFKIVMTFSRLALTAAARWLDAIGILHRLAIGRLTLEFDTGNVSLPRLQDMVTWFLAKLSKDAQIVCEASGISMASKIWKLGNALRYMHESRIPAKLQLEGQRHSLDIDITAHHVDKSELTLGPGGLALSNGSLCYIERSWIGDH